MEYKNMEQETIVNIWDIQQGESKRAYELFWEYYQMGPKRSITKLALKHNYKDWKNPRALYKWNKQFKWDLRIKSYIANIIQTSFHNALLTANEMIDNILIAFNIASKVLLKKINVSAQDLEKLDFKELFKIMIEVSKVTSSLVELKSYSKEQSSMIEGSAREINSSLTNIKEENIDEIIKLLSDAETNQS